MTISDSLQLLTAYSPKLKVVEVPNVGLAGDCLWYTEFPDQKDGMWAPYPDRPGLGLKLDPDAVARFSV